MKNNYYFGRTLSEKLEKARETVQFLNRDQEWLKEDGISQMQLDKSMLLISEVEGAGTNMSQCAPRLESTASRNEVRKQILTKITRLNACLKLNSNGMVDVLRKINLRGVKNASTKEFNEKMLELIGQLNNQRADYSTEAQIDSWIVALNQLLSDYNQAKSDKTLAETNRRAAAAQRNIKLAETLTMVSNMAKIAGSYWKSQNDPRYKDYIISFTSTPSKTTVEIS